MIITTVTRYLNGVFLPEEDVSKIVISSPAVLEIFEKVQKRVNNEIISTNSNKKIISSNCG